MDRKRSSVAHCAVALHVELLEDRTVPSIFTPAQIQGAYGFNKIAFSGSAANGAGQTIAIVDAYDDPNIMSDLQAFDRSFGLPDPPSFTLMKQSGTIASDQWSAETALDVEWAHAMAPGARIVLGEARSDNLSDLVAEVDTVADWPGVSVVSMSWSASEWSSESNFDSNFTTPAGHQGVTYVASSGDGGSPPSWPATSPNVLSVGGTSLYTSASGSYLGEAGWSLSGGGVSADEAKPAYQNYVSTGSAMRTSPDVSFDASPATGLYAYNTYGGNGWVEVGGTSAGAPEWAALVAIADQGRALAGKSSLDGASQTLYAIYRMAQTSESTYFHDVTTGSNGYSAKVGYDDVTGNGTPVANQIVAGLVAWNGVGESGYVSTTPLHVASVAKKAASAVEVSSSVDSPLANDEAAWIEPQTSIPTPATSSTSLPIHPLALNALAAMQNGPYQSLHSVEALENTSEMNYSTSSGDSPDFWNSPISLSEGATLDVSDAGADSSDETAGESE